MIMEKFASLVPYTYYHYVKMLHYNKIKTSEGIDINKSNKSREGHDFSLLVFFMIITNLSRIYVMDVMIYQ